MSKIRILSEHLANQIAAGEVIERPASVVKEFIENSIDAGARHLNIQVEGGGVRLVRVMDDGHGMDQDDVLLCLERHATSKLTGQDNDEARLTDIKTLGFRGEAIPSIASVAKLTITSRIKGAELGTRVEVRYGKVTKIHETGAGQGTIMEVRNLFGNMPARKKFLKTTRTELSHIEEIVKNYALANHRLGITYMQDNTPVIELPADLDSVADRLKRLSGRRPPTTLIPVENSGQTNPKISGFLLPPDELAGQAARLRIFVNHRAVKDRMIAHAVAEGLRGFMMKGRTAAGVLFLDLPPGEIDVNVHPTKQEIRFQRADAVHKQVVEAVRRAMEQFQQDFKFSLFGQPAGQIPDTGKQAAARTSRDDRTLPPLGGTPYSQADLPLARKRRPYTTREEPAAFRQPAGSSASHQRPEARQEPPPAAVSADLKLNPIGQLLDLYILCESPDGLVVIDQHAAHERLLFENLKKQFRTGKVASQGLMFPKMVELDAAQAEALQENRQEIENLGMGVEEFGGSSHVIKAVPAIMAKLPPEEVLAGILDQYAGNSGDTRQRPARLEEILASMACKAAIKAGRSLQPSEMTELLKQMRESNAFSHCPHGRPTVKSFSVPEIKKWFHRG